MEDVRVSSAPESMYYIHDFISVEEEASILAKIPANRWVTLSHRRLQAIPARLTASNVLVSSSPLPEWLARPILDRINGLGIFAGSPHGANHCLVNEYLAGQGILAHEDGNAYFPITATVSLGGSVVLDVTQKPSKGDHADSLQLWRILQEPRSLLITKGAAYVETLHGIAEVKEDKDLGPETIANWDLLGNPETFSQAGGVNKRTTRTSLTFRDVHKMSTLGTKIFGKSRT